jgi:hypothetical protein
MHLPCSREGSESVELCADAAARAIIRALPRGSERKSDFACILRPHRQTPLNRRKSAAPEMLLGVNDDDKEKENLRSQNADTGTPSAAPVASFTPFKKMLDR